MAALTTVPARLALLALSVCTAGAAAGCQEQATDPAGEPSVCPGCDPRAGGETSDFGGGTPTACGWISGPTAIDEDEAEALGYDVRRIRRLIEREFDAPLHWEARATEVGEPARGYDEHTRVRGHATLGAFTHVRPDPEFCDGTTCTREETTVEQATCPHFLLIELEVHLETLDGAIHAVAHGDAAQWAEGFEDMIGDDTADHPIGHAYANLHDVTGSLELFPPEEAFDGDPGPTASQGGHPFPGTLTVVLEFMEDATHGVVSPTLWWETVDEHGDNELEGYEPLRGTWPAEE